MEFKQNHLQSSQIQSQKQWKKSSNETLKNSLKSLSKRHKNKKRTPVKNCRNSLKPVPLGRAWTHGRLSMDARSHARRCVEAMRPCVGFVPCNTLCDHDAQSCVPATVPVSYSGASFDLYSSPDSSWMLSFSQTPKVLPESIDKLQYKHNYIKGGESIPFSSKISIEIKRNRDPIRHKRGFPLSSFFVVNFTYLSLA